VLNNRYHYRRFVQSFFDRYQPRNFMEDFHVQLIADWSWTLRQIEGIPEWSKYAEAKAKMIKRVERHLAKMQKSDLPPADDPEETIRRRRMLRSLQSLRR
jgi:hypothetical protein